MNLRLVFMGENHDFEKGGKDLGRDRMRPRRCCIRWMAS